MLVWALVPACDQRADVGSRAEPAGTDPVSSPSPKPSAPVDGAAPLQPAKRAEIDAAETDAVPSVEAQAAALVSAMESLGKTHTQHADDCEALAAALNKFVSEHGATFEAQTPQVQAWIDGDAATRTRLRAAMESVITGGMGCRDHAAIQAFYAARKPTAQ